MFSGCKLFSWLTAIVIVLTLIGIVMFFINMPDGTSGGAVAGFVIGMGINIAIMVYLFKMYGDCAGRQDIIATELGPQYRSPKAFRAKIQDLKGSSSGVASE